MASLASTAAEAHRRALWQRVMQGTQGFHERHLRIAWLCFPTLYYACYQMAIVYVMCAHTTHRAAAPVAALTLGTADARIWS